MAFNAINPGCAIEQCPIIVVVRNIGNLISWTFICRPICRWQNTLSCIQANCILINRITIFVYCRQHTKVIIETQFTIVVWLIGNYYWIGFFIRIVKGSSSSTGRNMGYVIYLCAGVIMIVSCYHKLNLIGFTKWLDYGLYIQVVWMVTGWPSRLM